MPVAAVAEPKRCAESRLAAQRLAPRIQERPGAHGYAEGQYASAINQGGRNRE